MEDVLRDFRRLCEYGKRYREEPLTKHPMVIDWIPKFKEMTGEYPKLHSYLLQTRRSILKHNPQWIPESGTLGAFFFGEEESLIERFKT